MYIYTHIHTQTHMSETNTKHSERLGSGHARCSLHLSSARYFRHKYKSQAAAASTAGHRTNFWLFTSQPKCWGFLPASAFFFSPTRTHTCVSLKRIFYEQISVRTSPNTKHSIGSLISALTSFYRESRDCFLPRVPTWAGDSWLQNLSSPCCCRKA